MASVALIERGTHLSALADALRAVVRESNGRLALVAGEAGVGKSALVREFCRQSQDTHRVLQGACDPLFTPRPLGPFLDVVHDIGGEPQRLAERGARPHEFVAVLLAELKRAPTVLALEDLHWADKASLDVLSLLVRRLTGVPVLVVATYRDDELGRSDPLRVVLGEWGQSAIRVGLGRLSPAGVTELVRGRDVDVDALYQRTGGNPFFVTEVLAARGEDIPLTVRDAVLARVARLSEPARQVLDAVAVMPYGCEYWLLDRLAPGGSDHLEECLASGVLVAGSTTLTFRHDLARLAVESTLQPTRRALLHHAALRALQSVALVDVTRLAHHAEAAGDAAAVREFAPRAGERAAALGAHREAAEQYARALRFAGDPPPDAVGDWLDRRAFACYLSGDFEAAVESQRRAFEHHRAAGDSRRHGAAARSLSLMCRYRGDLTRAWELGREAVDVLEPLGPGHELAMAYCNLSHLAANAEDVEQTREWAAKASALAAAISDIEASVYVSLNVGTIDQLAGRPGWRETVEHTLRIALDHDLEEHAGRAYVSLTWWSPRGRAYAEADRHVDEGLRYCDDRGLTLWRSYLLAYRARSCLDRGRWDEAVEWAGLALRDPRTSPVPRAAALAVIGVVRARRGEPDPFAPLDDAWTLVRDAGELQRIEPVAVARAEAAWLAGRHESAVAAALDLATTVGSRWVCGEMLAWQRRAGALPTTLPTSLPRGLPEPFASELAGDGRRAAEHWLALASPYEAALALAFDDDVESAREGLDHLLRLGARQAAALAARRLRKQGVRRLPRGPRPTTRGHPGQLTSRELDVLALLTNGLRTREIADKLVLSPRTVEHHVEAILRKLTVRTRFEAVRDAVRLGLVPARDSAHLAREQE